MAHVNCFSKGKNSKIEYFEITTQGYMGNAKWYACYNLSKTGRPIHNKIVAHFEFKDDEMIRHTDYFNLYS